MKLRANGPRRIAAQRGRVLIGSWILSNGEFGQKITIPIFRFRDDEAIITKPSLSLIYRVYPWEASNIHIVGGGKHIRKYWILVRLSRPWARNHEQHALNHVLLLKLRAPNWQTFLNHCAMSMVDASLCLTPPWVRAARFHTKISNGVRERLFRSKQPLVSTRSPILGVVKLGTTNFHKLKDMLWYIISVLTCVRLFFGMYSVLALFLSVWQSAQKMRWIFVLSARRKCVLSESEGLHISIGIKFSI